jgi:hypothetical protein
MRLATIRCLVRFWASMAGIGDRIGLCDAFAPRLVLRASAVASLATVQSSGVRGLACGAGLIGSGVPSRLATISRGR